MDFGKLLSVAQKNSGNKQNVSYYSTKYTPPKKESKQSKALSDNIKKFLARKEEEDKNKALEEKKKKENLLALRDHKAQSRINKHLKVTKSANKSVLADAINTEDTAVTITGYVQPDEDDYGYVSQEASAFYDRLMNKYSHSPDKPLFSDSGKRIVKDIASTKDRVKQALKQQEIDDSLPHRRKRKSADVATGSGAVKDNEVEELQSEKTKEVDKVKKKRPPMPPPIDFASLLKIAEKRQHEPIVIEPKPKPKPETVEYERPMTKKQKKEFMKEKEWRDKREREKNNDQSNSSVSPSNSNDNSTSNDSTSKLSKPAVNKNNSKLYNELTKSTNNRNLDSKNVSPKPTQPPNPSIKMKTENTSKPPVTKVNSKLALSSEKDQILEERRKLEQEKRKLESMRRMIEEEKRKLAIENKAKRIAQEAKSLNTNKLGKTNDKLEPSSSSSSSSNLKDSKLKQVNSTNSVNKPRMPSSDPGKTVRQFPPADCYNNKPKQFPPPDMMRRKPMKPSMNGNGRRPGSMNKRRIYDDEDEYDSELDDFIDDDDPHGESEDYSKYISEIFGYDKNKYKNFDDDDTNMESNYAQQLREEFVSTKIGIMEDLEDIRKEALEKKQKSMVMKKTKRKM